LAGLNSEERGGGSGIRLNKVVFKGIVGLEGGCWVRLVMCVVVGVVLWGLACSGVRGGDSFNWKTFWTIGSCGAFVTLGLVGIGDSGVVSILKGVGG